jgi:two-component system, LytTR family, sensor kinase
MKIIICKKQLVTALHLLFWMVSFNAFNLFFSRGVNSGYALEGFDIKWWNVLIYSTILFIIIAMPSIWFIKGLKRWIKWVVTAFTLTFLVTCAILFFYPKKSNEDLVIILSYFLDNVIYVLIFHITIIAAVYLNINVLIKRFLSQGKFGLYLAAAVGLTLAAGITNYAMFNLLIDKVFPQLFYLSWFKIHELFLIMTGYMAITTIVFLLWQYWVMIIANREKVQNELSALRAQINPHFLFNNLNTIYALAEKGDLRTKDVILQLSDFLRYVLYDTSSENIPLEKEIEIIKTYVELQKERINQDLTDIILNIEGDFSGSLIAPLLLLPLVENCFKHGLGKNRGTIQIDIIYSAHQLHFCTKNPVARRENSVNQDFGGIGIKNVEKRLNLLYPEKHFLRISEEVGLFIVDLKIKLE